MKIVVSVKGGGIKQLTCALNHVREREKAEFALSILLEPPTPLMVKDPASVGSYTSVAGKKFARGCSCSRSTVCWTERSAPGILITSRI